MKPFYHVTAKIHLEHDLEHDHILSGNLRIRRDNKLRKLITEGSKYTKPSTICWDKAISHQL